MPPERPHLFDFHAARLRRWRLRDDGFLFAVADEGLADRLATVTRRFGRGLCIGAAVPDALRDFAQDWTAAELDQAEYLAVAPQSIDLAVSLFSLQAVNDLPGALVQIRRALKPDGLFVGALFGGATLQELRDSFAHAELESLGGVSPRISPFGDVRDMGHLLQRAGFALPVADVERSLVRYGDFMRLAADLRAHGQTNVMTERSRKFLRRDTLAALKSHYARHHAADGKLNATFEIVYLTGWAPHESQQQPLKPGSAKSRLADALGTKEHKA
jgi:SAM-dependent methyltransferase